MLEEAIEVIRTLWRGGYQDHHGRFYTVENARLYTRPDTPPPLMIAAGGRKSAMLAARHGDGLIGTSPDREMLQAFRAGGGPARPCYGELTVCWARDEATARRIAHQWWPTAAMESALSWELPLPAHFEAAAQLVTEDAVAETVTCGPDPGRHLAAIEKYAEAGYDHVCVHHVGPDQEGFLKFYEREVLPRMNVGRAAA
jgi:G6PDH family F420-dependent oxidoreductase